MMFASGSVFVIGFLVALLWGVRLLTRAVGRAVAAMGHGIIATDPPLAPVQQPSGAAVTSHRLTRQQPRTRAIRSRMVPPAPELPERLHRLLQHGNDMTLA